LLQPHKPRIEALLQGGQASEALEVIRSVSGVAAPYHALLQICREVTCGERGCVAVYKLLGVDGPVDEQCYALLIGLLCAGGLVDRALRVRTRMRKAGLTPSAQTHVALVEACIEHSKPSLGATLVKQAAKDPQSAPGLPTFNALLGACNTIEDATLVFQSLAAAGHTADARSFESLVRAGCAGADGRFTVKALRQMARLGHPPHAAMLESTIKSMASLDVLDALKILEMCAGGTLPLPSADSVQFFLSLCCERGACTLFCLLPARMCHCLWHPSHMYVGPGPKIP
jgi:pentatricopeptide repeat protein